MSSIAIDAVDGVTIAPSIEVSITEKFGGAVICVQDAAKIRSAIIVNAVKTTLFKKTSFY